MNTNIYNAFFGQHCCNINFHSNSHIFAKKFLAFFLEIFILFFYAIYIFVYFWYSYPDPLTHINEWKWILRLAIMFSNYDYNSHIACRVLQWWTLFAFFGFFIYIFDKCYCKCVTIKIQTVAEIRIRNTFSLGLVIYFTSYRVGQISLPIKINS